jgi:uncharacterized protein YdhG (YjbR/CyaY superfamily)
MVADTVGSLQEKDEFSMEEKKVRPTTVDEYIAQFPEDVQQILSKIRAVIKESAPGATEKISYQMPAFYLNGTLVWIGAHKHHIGLYPMASGIEVFKDELSAYSFAKGSVQFPLDQPIPYDLIRKIVKFRVAENKTAKDAKGKREGHE